MNFCLKVVKKRDYARMDYSLALMQGKNSRFFIGILERQQENG
jgi:hypothetical protein